MPEREAPNGDQSSPEEDLPAIGGGGGRRKMAVALQYEGGKNRAPQIAASGRGTVADCIVEIAAEHGIPIREDPDLVQLLVKLDLGEEIPSQLYPVIAEVFAFVYRLNAERRMSLTASGGPP